MISSHQLAILLIKGLSGQRLGNPILRKPYLKHVRRDINRRRPREKSFSQQIRRMAIRMFRSHQLAILLIKRFSGRRRRHLAYINDLGQTSLTPRYDEETNIKNAASCANKTARSRQQAARRPPKGRQKTQAGRQQTANSPQRAPTDRDQLPESLPEGHRPPTGRQQPPRSRQQPQESRSVPERQTHTFPMKLQGLCMNVCENTWEDAFIVT